MIEAFICTDLQLDIVIQKPSISFSKSFTRVGDTEVSMDRLSRFWLDFMLVGDHVSEITSSVFLRNRHIRGRPLRPF